VNEEKYEEFYYRHHGGWGYGHGSQLYAALDQVGCLQCDKRPVFK
jgi:hypothetical protein